MADNITTDNLENIDDLNPRSYLNDNSKFISRTSGLDESINFLNLYEQVIDIAKSPDYNTGWNADKITGVGITSESQVDKDIFVYSTTEDGYVNRRLLPNDIDWSQYDENDFVKINSNGELVPSDISVTDLVPTDVNNNGKFLQVSADGTRIEESDFDFDSLLHYPDVSEADANLMLSGIYVAGYSTINKPATGEQGYIVSSRLRTDPNQTNPRVAQMFISTDSDDVKFRRNSGTLGINDFENWYTVYTDVNHPISDSVSSTSSVDIASSNSVKIVNDKIVDLESRYNGTEILSRLITVDGPGSELNADRLDGYQFSDLESRYVNVTGDTITGTLNVTGGNKIRYSNGTSFLDIKADSSFSTFDTNNAVVLKNGSLNQRIFVGGLLVSNNYSQSSLVPINGVYSQGKVTTGTGYDVGGTEVVDTNGRVSWNRLKDVPSEVETLGTASQRDVGTAPNEVPSNSLIASQLLPPGAVLPFAGTTAPNGWVVCDGGELSRTVYSELYAYIGVIYGNGNGSTTFNVPNLNDEFVRGSSGTRPVGTQETDEIRSHGHTGSTNTTGLHGHTGSTNTTGEHSHKVKEGDNMPIGSGLTSGDDFTGIVTYQSDTTLAGNHSHSISLNSAGNHSHILNINNTGGSETRPRNVAMLYCIKY